MNKRLSGLLLGFALVAAGAGSALAGSGNVLYLLQETDAGATNGNSFHSDQSAASYSAIGSLARFATQSGAGNDASVTLASPCAGKLASTCGTVALQQDNSAATLAGLSLGSAQAGNHATIAVTGTGNASISQLGDANTAYLTLDEGTGSIAQQGLSNSARLLIEGSVTGSIAQTGNSDVASLHLQGSGNPVVTLEQHGSNMNYVGGTSTDGATTGTLGVSTNGNVTIQQWNF